MSEATTRVQPKRSPRREVFSPRQAAEFLGISEGTMFRLLQAGRVPFVRTGGPGSRYLIGRARLTEWVNNGGLTSSSLPSNAPGENAPALPSPAQEAARSVAKRSKAQTRRSA